jgi:hypothetical protein
MAVSSNLALEARSIHAMKSGSENLNGAGTTVSDKVHLDEIAVSLKRQHRGGAARCRSPATALIACRSRMAPI